MTDIPSVPCPDSPCPDYPYTGNKDTNSNSNKNKQFSFFNNNSPSVSSAPMGARDTDGQDATDDIEQKIMAFESLLKTNVAYDDLRSSYPRDMRHVDEIIAIMVDVLVTPGAYVALDGENKPRRL